MHRRLIPPYLIILPYTKSVQIETRTEKYNKFEREHLLFLLINKQKKIYRYVSVHTRPRCIYTCKTTFKFFFFLRLKIIYFPQAYRVTRTFMEK